MIDCWNSSLMDGCGMVHGLLELFIGGLQEQYLDCWSSSCIAGSVRGISGAVPVLLEQFLYCWISSCNFRSSSCNAGAVPVLLEQFLYCWSSWCIARAVPVLLEQFMDCWSSSYRNKNCGDERLSSVNVFQCSSRGIKATNCTKLLRCRLGKT